ncbi:MAG: HAMP domain-containing histidine kinase, partial [Proteobacteria bacterium]|nr:HAMP domain-containing histidine kinase [Pseudomonadota bacterium]
RYPEEGVEFRLIEGNLLPVAHAAFIDDLPFERPLDRWRVAVYFAPDNPAVSLFGPTAWLYTLGLIALVVTVVVGTTITLVSAGRTFRLSRLQTDFVSNVSHELRTPLTSIRMFVETLQSGRIDNPERTRECLNLLSSETERLSRMIERVLDWARLEKGRQVYVLEVVDCQQLIEKAIEAFHAQQLLHVHESPLSIEVTVPPELPRLKVDGDAIVEALLNLLQNAFKYTPAPREIKISATSRGRRVGLSVSDNGPGIVRQDRKRIFEKFYQSDSLLSSPRRQGSGLGLSIVRAVVKGHGGRVELVTEVGKGSQFTLWLPSA